MVHVNYFLGCVKLETGGIIIAWLHIILYVIAIGSLIVKLIFELLFGFRVDDTNTNFEAEAITPNIENLSLALRGDDTNTIVKAEEITPTTKYYILILAVLAIILVVVLAAMIAVIVVAYRSIKAIKTRNHNIMLEMVGTTFAIACLHLYAFFIAIWLAPLNSIPALIGFAICFYIFIVIYSLYRVFRKEYERRLEQQLKASA